MLTPRRLSEPGFLDTLRDSVARLRPGRRLRRAGAAGRAGRAPARLGQPALLAAAGLARRGAGAGRAAARRRDHRRRDLPAGGGPRHRPGVRAWSPRPSPPRTPRATCWAGSRCPAPGCWPRRSTGIADGTRRGPAAAGRGRLARAEGHRRGRPGRLGRARACAVDRLVRAVTPEPGRVDDLPRRAARTRPGAPGRRCRRPELKPGELHAEKRRVLVGTATAPVRLGEVRPVGRRPMPAADWARGVRIEPGEVLA